MENSDIKPSTIMLIAGGAVLLLSTFLDWQSEGGFGANGWDTDFYGFHGIFVAVIGLVIALGVALQQFANVDIPDRILGFDHNQVHLVLGFAAFLITFGNILLESVAIGVHLGWIASAVIIAAAIMDMRAGATDSAAPTTF
jgi:hypothetical protein